MTSGSIDKKKDGKNEEFETNDNPKNNWSGFAIGCLVNFILVFLVGIVVSNFMYFTRLSTASLDKLFPSDDNNYFQQNYTQLGGSSIEIGDLGDRLRHLGVPPTSGWPYTMKKGNAIEFSTQGFKNWFSLSIADAYALLRNSLKVFISKIAIMNDFHNFEKFIISFMAVSLIFVALVSLPIVIYGSSFIRTWNDGGILFTLFAFLTAMFSSLAGGLSLVITLQYLLTILFLPILIDSKMVGSIARQNTIPLAILFRALCVVSAIMSLKDSITIPVVMAIYTVVSVGLYRLQGIVI